MLRSLLFAAGVSALLGTPAAQGLRLQGEATLHHMHLVTMGVEQRLEFYARLFVPGAVERGTFWGVEGVGGRGMHLLASPTKGTRAGTDTTAWHFGWGRVSVGETYASHYAKEVNWKPPYRALDAQFHVHLRSPDPKAAARWYRDVLGATVEEGPVLDDNHGEPERVDAVVRVGRVHLALHRWEGALAPTRTAGLIDHLAFAVRNPQRTLAEAQAHRPGPLPRADYPLPGLDTLALEGPDGLLIELVQASREPGFWREDR